MKRWGSVASSILGGVVCVLVLLGLADVAPLEAQGPHPPSVGSTSEDPSSAAVDASKVSVFPTPTAPYSVELVSHLGGPAAAVVVRGNYAYVGMGPELAIMDISNPAQPTRVGYTVLLSPPTDIALAGNYAYVATQWAGLRIIDISNASAPTEVSSYALGTNIYASSVTITGTVAYVTAGTIGLRIVDISNPLVPVTVGVYQGPAWSNDVAVVGSLAYLGVDTYGLRILNVATPSSIFDVGYFDTPGNLAAVSVIGNLAYIADTSGGLRIVNVVDPAAPTEIGVLNTTGQAVNLTISGSLAYVAQTNQTLQIVNVANPAAPTPVESFSTAPSSPAAVAIVGARAYVAAGDAGVKVVDVTTPTAPVEVGAYSPAGLSRMVAVKGNRAYLFDSMVRIIDVANPAAPTPLVAFGPFPYYVTDIDGQGNLVYLSEQEGLHIIDASNPISPTQVGFWSSPASNPSVNVVVSGTLAYVTRSTGVVVLDIANPATPIPLSTLSYARKVVLVGNLAYTDEASVYSMANPAAPVLIGSLPVYLGQPRDLAVANRTAYIVGERTGMQVVDFSDPAHPTPTNSTASIQGGTVEVSGTVAYTIRPQFSAGPGWMSLFDISNPPTFLTFYHQAQMSDITLSGDFLYGADGFGGLRILRVRPPSGDFTHDGRVTVLDVTLVAQAWHQRNTPYDMNGDGIITLTDVMRVVALWEG